LHAARVAARLRRVLGVEVDMVRGRYGEFEVLVDGAPVVAGGRLAALGVLPSARRVVAAVRDRLSAGPTPRAEPDADPGAAADGGA
jgi:hypothetical protein